MILLWKSLFLLFHVFSCNWRELSRYLFLFEHVSNILLQDCTHDDRRSSKDQVVKRYVHVIKESLARVCTKEGSDELRYGEKHVFVEKVHDHFADANVVPSAMD